MNTDLHETAKTLRETMRCNCDLDNWQPEQDTGHSWVCRIHKKCKIIERQRLQEQTGE
jgi:hypothetical protein